MCCFSSVWVDAVKGYIKESTNSRVLAEICFLFLQNFKAIYKNRSQAKKHPLSAAGIMFVCLEK